MHIKDVEVYTQFLDSRINNNLIDTLTIPQKQSLIDAYSNFPLGLVVKTNHQESIEFMPEPAHSLCDYIHHFLIKYNNGRDWYSKKYLTLLALLKNTIEENDERILHIQGRSDRICFVKRYNSEGGTDTYYHVVPCNILSKDKIIAWTHFHAKEKYIRSLKKVEEDLILQRKLVDLEGKFYEIDYNGYNDLKRKTLLYLGSNVLSELHRSQEPPLNLSQISTIQT